MSISREICILSTWSKKWAETPSKYSLQFTIMGFIISGAAWVRAWSGCVCTVCTLQWPVLQHQCLWAASRVATKKVNYQHNVTSYNTLYIIHTVHTTQYILHNVTSYNEYIIHYTIYTLHSTQPRHKQQHQPQEWPDEIILWFLFMTYIIPSIK